MKESFRRHMEEIALRLARRSASPGSSHVPMYYKGRPTRAMFPLCPIVVTPTHWVEELPTTAISKRTARCGARSEVLGHGGPSRRTSVRGHWRSGAMLSGFLGVFGFDSAVGPHTGPAADRSKVRSSRFERTGSGPGRARLAARAGADVRAGPEERAPRCLPLDEMGASRAVAPRHRFD